MARNDEFNRDMSDYLRSRRVIKRTNPFLSAKSYFMGMFRKSGQQREVRPNDEGDLTPEQVQAVMQQGPVRPVKTAKTVQRQAAAPKPAASAPVPTQKKVKSMGWFSKRKEEDDYEELPAAAPQQQALDEDVREVLKITFKWLKQMPPEQIEEIKNSRDFEKYKAVLDKYGLIKK